MSLTDNPITETSSSTYSVDIHIAGDRSTAVAACREFCMEGLCVSVSDADYVFTGGMESGVRIGLINYPRFPKPGDEILDTAKRLAHFLIERLHQQSCTVVAPDQTIWLSRRA